MRPRKFYWPIASKDSICAAQAFTTGVPLVFNGTLSASKITNTGEAPKFVIFDNFSRKVSISSAANLSGIQFTVTGNYYGKEVSDTFNGPSAGGTVESGVIFSSVTSVTANATSANTVSVGFGTEGHTAWTMYSHQSLYHTTSVQVIVNNTIDYSLEATNQDVSITDSADIVVFNPDPSVVNVTSNSIGLIDMQTRFFRININNSGDTAELTAYCIQGGV